MLMGVKIISVVTLSTESAGSWCGHGRSWVATRYACYKLVSDDDIASLDSDVGSPLKRVRQYCTFLGGSLATPKRQREWDELDNTLRSIMLNISFRQHKTTVIGLYWGDVTLPNMYRFSVVAEDKTVLHNTFLFGKIQAKLGAERLCLLHRTAKSCCTNIITRMFTQWTEHCHKAFRKQNAYAVCEVPERANRKDQTKSESIQLHNVSVFSAQDQLTSCSNGHRTHIYLACGPHSVCAQGRGSPCLFSNMADPDKPRASDGRATSVVLFSCDEATTQLSFSALCDFTHDCQDKTDESFCRHLCDDFLCTNGQCVSYSKRCDRLSDCLDESDESDCAGYRKLLKNHHFVPVPALINFDGISDFIQSKMKPDELCPVTHYRCPGDVNNCLPVYTRCNGVYDCVGHEDEDSCEDMRCPGFFRCRSSSVCVHGDNLCDGWPHCPLHDDELFCGLICPEVCLCHGHAFLCPQSFSAHLFPDLRYLDATGSGLSASDVSSNPYLVYLSLAQCSLLFLSHIKLSNLQFLDLSSNKLESVDMSYFFYAENLGVLSLANNPLSALYTDPTSVTQHTGLRTLDVSHTMLTVFDSQVISHFQFLDTLNLSFTTIHTIGSGGFQSTPLITKLVMEGSPVTKFPPDLFTNMYRLHTISSRNYKLCCTDILPPQFEDGICTAPEDEISSCRDLLQTEIYRVFLWLISCLCLTGNVFCFVLRLTVLKSSLKGFSVFVTNLTMADFLMGVYITIIGIADTVYKGSYSVYDTLWKSSVACQSAGFLSLLSSEVSALIICLITLDRFLVLRFPFSNFQFKTHSAVAVCLISWIVGVCVASCPLLPVTAHWEFYSQTGICLPLPVTRQDFKGRVYSYSVMIVFNFVLFLLISAGQAFIYVSVQKNALTTSTTKASNDMTIARRLITVALTDFMCWFPIGFCGILSLSGIAIPGEVNVALAIFILPLNPALNPYLYTYNTLMEKRRKLNEAKLLRWLESNTAFLEN